MSTSSPQADHKQEVRFAVVMYGGVSLAIYINGVAQELLRLVRSTAIPQTPGSRKVEGTDKIYRIVSYLLSKDGPVPTEKMLEDPNTIPPTRFVVDILSGTSAGGINAIFLGKALANGQDMEQLKELWVREGDIEKLINDKMSVEGVLTQQSPPSSLLNSERMYLELLKAFDGMDGEEKRSDLALSPFVDELDLFITSTDLQGVVLPIRLSDGLVYERRHRNVMRFVYSSPAVSGEDEPRNDFHKKFNPFLAFAARCTSSFPFAFEPMVLSDTDKILNRLKEYYRSELSKSESAEWQRFFKDYLDPRGVSSVAFPKRAFGDGGYLDNKPFTYATETLMNRNADVPVDRKLIYIEPSPEHPEDIIEVQNKPDAIQNVMAALISLPRHETIREDLERVKERNRLIERVNAIAEGVDRDYFKVKPLAKMRGGQDSTEEEWKKFGALASLPQKESWAKPIHFDKDLTQFDLTDMIKRKGRGYVAYQRLRISSVTDELARLIARVGDLDENSDYFVIVRSFVRAWRVRTYYEHRDDAAGRKGPLNQFLYEFDLSYPLRRVNYLRKKVDSLYRLDEEALSLIDAKAREMGTGESKPVLIDERPVLKQEFLKSKAVLNEIFTSLRKEARAVRSRRSAKVQTSSDGVTVTSIRTLVDSLVTGINARVSELRGVDATKLSAAELQSGFLDYFLGSSKTDSYQAGTGEDVCEARALKFLDENPSILDAFNKAAEEIQNRIADVKTKTEGRCIGLFTSTNTNPLADNPRTNSLMWLARNCLGHYYNNYEDYDLLIYPILFDTNVGEADVVDIIRISPEDATQLINERKTGCRKLAGTALGNFGAFLQKSWRQNDILWGRLDGAERLISALLPNHPLRARLIGEAQAAIVMEAIGSRAEKERYTLLSEALMRTRSKQEEAEVLEAFIKSLIDNCSSNKELHDQLAKLIDSPKLVQFYKDSFAKQSKVKPESALRSAARATTVVGQILESMSSERHVNTKYGLWIARFGQIFWALLEVAVPRSMMHLIFRHWLKLIYFLEALMILGSTLLVAKEVQRFALSAFGITAAIHLVVVILGDLLGSKRKWIRLVKSVLLSLVVVLIGLGGLTLSSFFGAEKVWTGIVASKNWFNGNTDTLWLACGGVVVLVLLWSMRNDLKEFINGT